MRAAPRSTDPSLRPPRVGGAHEEASIEAALHEAAHHVLGGDPTTAVDRLHVAIAKGDGALFSRVGDALAEQVPFDAHFVARALASLQAAAMDDVRASDARLRARNRALAHSAHHDPLTRIANRATLDESLAIEMRRALRYGQPFSVLFADIDHFKRINDTHGHAVGDHVLRQVAARIGHSLRPGDVFGRYGGEEFVVGLVHADARAALRAAERLRRDVERTPFDDGGPSLHVTISLGVATMTPSEPLTLAALIDRADRAMLHAKASGRNDVCAWCGATAMQTGVRARDDGRDDG